MAVYERLEGGEVVERVTTVDGSHEDTRIGVAALEGDGGWRAAGQPVPPPAASAASPADEQQTEPAQDEEGDDGVRDTGRPGRAARPRPGSR